MTFHFVTLNEPYYTVNRLIYGLYITLPPLLIIILLWFIIWH